MRAISQKTSEIFIKCFFELLLKPGYTELSRKIEQGFHAAFMRNSMGIQALQESFQNILGSESYLRNSDEMLKKFHSSNSAENPIFSPYD